MLVPLVLHSRPWKAADRFLNELKVNNLFQNTKRIKVDLYGSLSLTGKGHATDFAIMLGLSGQDPERIPIDNIFKIIKSITQNDTINLGNELNISFDVKQDIIFNKEFLPFHANGLKFTAYLNNNSNYSSTFYSIGGGFVVKEERINAKKIRN